MDDLPTRRPPRLDAIMEDAARLGFVMSCEERTGALLAALAASKPGGRLLELGTGVGAGTSWLLDGADPTATVTSVEVDPVVRSVAARHLGDPRLHLVEADVDAWLDAPPRTTYDLVYVDCMPGKFSRRDDVFALLAPGGLYIGDDLRPVPGWPDAHHTAVAALIDDVTSAPGLRTVLLDWSSGLFVAVRTP